MDRYDRARFQIFLEKQEGSGGGGGGGGASSSSSSSSTPSVEVTRCPSCSALVYCDNAAAAALRPTPPYDPRQKDNMGRPLSREAFQHFCRFRIRPS